MFALRRGNRLPAAVRGDRLCHGPSKERDRDEGEGVGGVIPVSNPAAAETERESPAFYGLVTPPPLPAHRAISVILWITHLPWAFQRCILLQLGKTENWILHFKNDYCHKSKTHYGLLLKLLYRPDIYGKLRQSYKPERVWNKMSHLVPLHFKMCFSYCCLIWMFELHCAEYGMCRDFHLLKVESVSALCFSLSFKACEGFVISQRVWKSTVVQY